MATCSVCSHPERDEISRNLIGGATVRDIEGRFGVSKSAVDRHRRRCLAPKVAAAIARYEEIGVERLTSYANGFLEDACWGLLRARKDEEWAEHRACLREARSCVETLAKLNGIGRAEVAVHVDARKQMAVLASLTEDELRQLAHSDSYDAITQPREAAAHTALEVATGWHNPAPAGRNDQP